MACLLRAVVIFSLATLFFAATHLYPPPSLRALLCPLPSRQPSMPVSSASDLNASASHQFPLSCLSHSACQAEGQLALDLQGDHVDYLSQFLHCHSVPGRKVVFAAVVCYGEEFMMTTHVEFHKLQDQTPILIYPNFSSSYSRKMSELCRSYNFACLNGAAWHLPSSDPSSSVNEASSSLKTMFTYEALIRGFDVIFSDIDTIWFRPFPLEKWLRHPSDFWMSDYGPEWDKCDVNRLSVEGRAYNFGGWCVRSTPRSIGVWKKYRATLLSDANPLCDDQQTWCQRFRSLCHVCLRDEQIMSTGCFSHWERFTKGLQGGAAFRTMDDEKPISLHMTGYFNPASKAQWLCEHGMHGYQRHSHYYKGKFLFFDTDNVDHFDNLLAYASRMNRTLICSLFKQNNLLYSLEALRHTKGSLENANQDGFRASTVYGSFNIRPFSFLRDAYWEPQSVRKVAIADLDHDISAYTDDLVVLTSIGKVAFETTNASMELQLIRNWTIPVFLPYVVTVPYGYTRDVWWKVHMAACAYHPVPPAANAVFVESYGQAWCRNVARPRNVYLDFGANTANSHSLYTAAVGEFHRDEPWSVWLFEPSPLMAPYNEVAVRRQNGESVREQDFEKIHKRLMTCAFENPSNPSRDYRPCASTLAELMDALEKLRKNVTLAEVLEIMDTGEVGGRQVYHFVNAAVGVEDTMAEFHFSPDNLVNGGSSMLAIDTHSEAVLPASVPVVDVASWILRAFRPADYVLVKVDIEGAEFDVLTKLLSSGAIRLIDEMKIEWHERFMPDKAHLKDEIMRQIARAGVLVDGAWG